MVQSVSSLSHMQPYELATVQARRPDKEDCVTYMLNSGSSSISGSLDVFESVSLMKRQVMGRSVSSC